MARKKQVVSDEVLLAELEEGGSGATVEVTDLVTASARLDVCLNCEFREALICTRIQVKQDSRLNIATASKRADIVCPESKW